MPLLTPPPIAPQRGDKSTFSTRLDAFITWIATFVAQMLALVSSLNTLATGGAYAIPYLVDLTSTADSDPTAGLLRFNAAGQNAATTIYLDLLGSDGIDYTAILDQLDASTSIVKCSLRMVKMGDPTKFLTFSVTARTTASGYRKLTLVNTGGSASSPFAQGDGVMLHFSRTGDKGDTGNVALVFHAREEQTANTAAVTPAWSANVAPRLSMNTVKQNDIGATLSGGRFTLLPGKYVIRARAPYGCTVANGTSATHATYILNNGAGTVVGMGPKSLVTNNTGSGFNTDLGLSEAIAFVSISAATQFQIVTVSGTSPINGGYPGVPSAQGLPEVYVEVFVEKIG